MLKTSVVALRNAAFHSTKCSNLIKKITFVSNIRINICRPMLVARAQFSSTSQKGTITDLDGNIYEGEVVDGKMHGVGSMKFKIGGTYTGTWVNGKRHGHGVNLKASGAMYTGSWINDVIQGFGTLEMPDGESVTGEWFNGKLHGKAKHTSPDGSFYDGDWVNGERSGKGVMVNDKGARYEGDFVSDQFHGKGILIVQDTFTYTGDFENGSMAGHGHVTTAEGEEYTGEFRNNSYFGDGQMRYINGDVYTGEFLDGKRHGTGKMVCTDGEVYEGEWVENRRQGRGVFSGTHGFKYEGEWKNDMINGQGDMLNVNGDHYIGELLNYQYHGYGLVVRKGFLDRLLNKEAVTAGLATEEEKERKWEEVRDIVSEQVVSFYEERESEARKKERSAISEDELLEITANTPATDFESMETKLDAVFAVQEKMKSGYVPKFHPDNYEKDTAALLARQAASEQEPAEEFVLDEYTREAMKEIALSDVLNTYEGLFKMGKQHGEGKMIYPNGMTYQGSWEDDKMHGFGVLRAPDGQVLQQGEFNKGEFIQEVKELNADLHRLANKEYAIDKMRKKLQQSSLGDGKPVDKK